MGNGGKLLYVFFVFFTNLCHFKIIQLVFALQQQLPFWAGEIGGKFEFLEDDHQNDFGLSSFQLLSDKMIRMDRDYLRTVTGVADLFFIFDVHKMRLGSPHSVPPGGVTFFQLKFLLTNFFWKEIKLSSISFREMIFHKKKYLGDIYF